MLTQSHEPVSHSHFSLSSSFTTFIQERNPLPYPSPTLVKHPIWFLNNADLFLSHNEILFGLHQDMFQSPHFSTILQTIEPGQTIAQGTTSTFPIPSNHISQTTLLAFILLRYYPRTFTTTRDNWLAIRSLALKWGFTQVKIRSLLELKHLDRRRLSPHQRQSLSLTGPSFVNTLQLLQRGNLHVRTAMTEDDEEN
jgi:hypothetical protein